MDCEACTDRLVDLLYEEIDDSDAAAARAHLAECESCAGALARLEKGRELASLLVMEEPPAIVRNAVLAAARERAASRAPVKVAEPRQEAREAREAPRPRDPDEDGGLWSSFLRWLGGFAMGPQVAMAMMLLLMVGIGLWYLPGLRSHDPSDPHAILDPAPGDEVAPSAGIAPAAPLDLEADPHHARIRPREGGEPPAPPRQPQVARPTPPPEEVAMDRAGDQDEADDDEAPPVVAHAERPSTADRRPAAGVRLEREEERGTVLSEPLPEPMAMQLDVAPGERALAEEQTVAPAAPPPQQAQAPAYAGAPAPTSRVAAPSAPTRAMPAEDVAGPPSAADSRYALAQAAHRRASSLRASGNCRAAVPVYQRLLAENPSYAQSHEARMELGDCYRVLGNYAAARPLFEQSTRDPRVASRAHRELVRLEAAERARDRATETDRTPDRPAPARQADFADEAASDSE